MAIKFTLLNILTKNLLPGGGNPAESGKAAPFTAYFCRDDRSLWISDAEGNLISISDLLSGNGAPRAFPAQGSAGRDGIPGPKGDPGKTGKPGADGRHGRDSQTPGPIGPQGSTGPQGAAGRDGRDGADSIVPGPKGDSIVGPRGEKGERGDVLIPNESELAAAVKELRLQKAKIHASFLEGMLKAKSLKNTTAGKHLELILEQIKRDAGL